MSTTLLFSCSTEVTDKYTSLTVCGLQTIEAISQPDKYFVETPYEVISPTYCLKDSNNYSYSFDQIINSIPFQIMFYNANRSDSLISFEIYINTKGKEGKIEYTNIEKVDTSKLAATISSIPIPLKIGRVIEKSSFEKLPKYIIQENKAFIYVILKFEDDLLYYTLHKS